MEVTSPSSLAPPWERLPVERGFRQLPDVRLEVAAAGPPGAPLVVLLHGFPDLWHGRHHQIAGLSQAGFRVLAPNQRGYGRSDKPKGVASYDIDRLAADVIALARSETDAPFYLVGHDWGGLVAWWAAAQWPEQVKRLVVLNAPHPGVFFPYLLRHPGQILKSWYIGFFQLPWVPEALLGARNSALLAASLDTSEHKGLFDKQDRHSLREGWSERGALTSMINYYRAAARRPSSTLRRQVTVPTRILWGRKDRYEEPGLAVASLDLCANASLLFLDQAGHWLPREVPHVVTEALVKNCSA